MIYPTNFEQKIGFAEIRRMLKERCLCQMGAELVDSMAFTSDMGFITRRLNEISQLRQLRSEVPELPLQHFYDMRQPLSRIKLENTHLEEEEVWDLRRSLETILRLVEVLRRRNDGQTDGDEALMLDESPEQTIASHRWPALYQLADGIATFPAVLRRIDSIMDKQGHIKDSATMTLAGIRHELSQMQGSISRTLYTILHAAQRDGLVDKDTAPTMRDGRLMLPVAPALKRRISGIVHDESATGKTVFIEPAEVVEANNRVRQLEAEERREILRILTVLSAELRPNIPALLDSYRFLAAVDFIQAKAELAEAIQAIEPILEDAPLIDWSQAIHPLLSRTLQRQGRQVVPLDISLGRARMLIISGPNAGGKSVCLKTVGLLQYMLQCGMSVPLKENSRCGIFSDIMIDIGDEQSIENDLSTYSSHLQNMKQMMKQSSDRTLLLIDEFGSGTEPTIGGAIAEAVLRQLWKKQASAVITTHYQNLKHFADDHEGVVNGAMLYDRAEMRPLFMLSVGQPGSSFAIEIARKTGLPEDVIREASDIVGSDYVQSDKYLQDIIRDKRYWEQKRQSIHGREKQLDEVVERYEREMAKLQEQRRDIMAKARKEAEELLSQTNQRIENTIREIREQQAEREATRQIRQKLSDFHEQVSGSDDDDRIDRKMRQLMERKARHEQRKKERERRRATAEAAAVVATDSIKETKKPAALAVGTTVRIRGLESVGQIESLQGQMATVMFGNVRTKMRIDKLEACDSKEEKTALTPQFMQQGRVTRSVIDEHRQAFSQDLDVRGMRVDEATNAVMHYIDDAILMGAGRVRILHGTGTGALRQVIRQYLRTVPNVAAYRDEHVQFGGAGITVVDID
ncbi:MAG: Smr/MutS family protein [Prevotella sp.]|nr:Smr/MutS family protein [Prevotella sp.]